jgi:signal transduction histidine kinase
MFAGLSDIGRGEAQSRLFLAAVAGLVALLALVWRMARRQARERRRERTVRQELEAYACFNPRVDPNADLTPLGRQVCRLVAAKSPFRRVAILSPNPDGRLIPLASTGMEAELMEALNTWAASLPGPAPKATDARKSLRSMLGRGIDVGSRSRAIVPTGHRGRLIVIPFATTADRRLTGAIVVGADHMLNVRRSLVDETIGPLETLAVKLGRAIENAVLAERLLQAERLAGLGLLASGVAHALNNPLTAVLGFAELIAETSAQPRVQQDAETIVREAQRMRDTVQSLLNLSHPPIHRDENIHFAALIQELGAACKEKLAARNVRLVIDAEAGIPPIRGNKDRLRFVMEHLLNNAAQAIATSPSPSHEIRIALTCNMRAVQIIVSDTGPGFRQPTRIFDPFYTTRKPGEGVGLGLSLCYGIIREHHGKITAFNLHPHGAAVMVELPTASSSPTLTDTFIGEVA